VKLACQTSDGRILNGDSHLERKTVTYGHLVTSLKAVTKEEGLGMDFSQHGEEAYADGEGAILVLQRPDSAASEGAGALAPAAQGGRS